MGLKDMWNNMFPPPEDFDEPIDLTPTAPKRSPEEALVELVCLDMSMYPSEWRRRNGTGHGIYRHEHDYINDKADLRISISQISDHSELRILINEVKIPGKFLDAIEKAYGNREIATLLEKLLDRVERVETVSVEEVKQEAAKQDLVDPFAPDRMEVLRDSLEALRVAAQPRLTGPKLPMMPTPSNFMSMKGEARWPSTPSNPPVVGTFCGIPIPQLDPQQQLVYKSFIKRNG